MYWLWNSLVSLDCLSGHSMAIIGSKCWPDWASLWKEKISGNWYQKKSPCEKKGEKVFSGNKKATIAFLHPTLTFLGCHYQCFTLCLSNETQYQGNFDKLGVRGVSSATFLQKLLPILPTKMPARKEKAQHGNKFQPSTQSMDSWRQRLGSERNLSDLTKSKSNTRGKIGANS